jgi:nucleotide-binding universal stress UspA family protein
MLGCVLAPLDGSALAARALGHAAALAGARHDRLLLLRVLTPQPRRGEALIQEPEARAGLERVADRLRATGIDVDTEISTTLFGSPAEVIVQTARRHQAKIIVMSTHGRSGLGRWLYGSVAEAVLRLAPVPVLLVPATSERAWPTERPPRLLLALDGSPLAAEATEPARTWAQALGAEVALVRVLPPRSAEAAAYVYEDPLAEQTDAIQALETAAASFRELGINASLHTPVGDAARRITDLAREQDVDAIAMATHGRSGLSRVVLGSVATETLHRAGLPMFLVRVPTAELASSPERAVDATSAPIGPMTLLVPLDLTEKADVVLPEAARLARAADADVVLLNVFMPIVELGRVATESREEGLAFLRAERRMYLEDKAEQLRGLRVSTRVEALPHGEEIDEGIARVAAETHASVVILASAHASSAAALVVGSVGQGVLARSPCPVMIVRCPATKPRTATTASSGQATRVTST